MTECPKCQGMMYLKNDPVFPLKSYYHCPSCLNDFPLKYKNGAFAKPSECENCGYDKKNKKNKNPIDWKNICVII
jgi:DNA-directed RNA polymerase subunit M/transcription elongation factor TFIIS